MLPSRETITFLSLGSIDALLSEPGTFLVDIRTEESFNEAHIGGALNICIYETAFMEKIGEAIPTKDSTLIVYGESSAFRAAEVAFGRLKNDGYGSMHVLEEGLAGWISAGRDTVTGSAKQSRPSGTLQMDLSKSSLRWIGRNPTNQHDGLIGLKSGSITLDESGAILEGEALVDMQQISCTDIEDKGVNGMLIAHLRNSDFFEVERYPEALFRFSKVETIPGNSPGQPNLEVSGELTLRGVTRPIDFQAMYTPLPDGVSFQAQLDVNRVLFGAVYGSGSLFERLGMHLVNDLVNIQITAVFR